MRALFWLQAAAELTVAGCTDVKERVLDVAEGLQVKLRAGDVALLHGSAVMVTKAENFEAHSLHMETLAPGSMPLPEMSVALSPLLDLHPHGMHFDEPVLLIFPVCVGATKVWRSSDAGWEELVDARLSAGHAILSLDHFCQVVAGAPEPVRKPIKIKGYMKEQTAKWTITHANCKNCEDMLEEYLADPDVLQGYRPCMPLFKTATYSHKQFLELSWPDPSGNANAEPGILNFEEFPVVSTSSWAAPSPPEVKLRLKDADSDSIIQRTLSCPADMSDSHVGNGFFVWLKRIFYVSTVLLAIYYDSVVYHVVVPVGRPAPLTCACGFAPFIR